eukprot:4717026-Pyramimonas_sp.AAC.1
MTRSNGSGRMYCRTSTTTLLRDAPATSSTGVPVTEQIQRAPQEGEGAEGEWSVDGCPTRGYW